jgi:hypothetical protein
VSISPIITLVGLLVEIVGAFVLAAEAIGLHRISAWVRALSLFRARSAGRRKEAPDSALHPNAQRICVACTSGIGAGFGSYLGTHPPSFVSHIPRLAFGLSAAALGGVVAVFAYQIILIICAIAIRLLLVVERRTRNRTVGVVGFVLLFLGFVLQFVGTLLQLLHS